MERMILRGLGFTVVVAALLIADVVQAQQCTDGVDITEVQILIPDEWGEFGSDVALDGDTALIGAWRDRRGNIFGPDYGAAYVYVRDGSCGQPWCQQAKLQASDEFAFEWERFGYSVALDGDTALIGENHGGNAEDRHGQAYFFTRNADGTWAQTQRVASDSPTALLSDGYGHSVALEGDTALIGAYSDGAVYVFQRSGGTWTQVQKIELGRITYGGYHLVLDGDTALIGAPFVTNTAGAAYVYVRDGTHGASCGQPWCRQATLLADDRATHDWFGGRVELDGDLAMVTAIYGDANGECAPTTGPGAVYVFTRSGSTWTQVQKLVSSDGVCGSTGAPYNPGQRFGWDLALQGDLAFPGAFYDDDLGRWSGSVYVFNQTSGIWTEQTKLTASDGSADALYGIGIAVEGDTLLVGARQGNRAYISAVCPVLDNYVCLRMGDALGAIAQMDDSSFVNHGHRTSLQNFLRHACAFEEKGNAEKTQDFLEKALERTDGCALRGAPDDAGGGTTQDSIVTCEDQGVIYPIIVDALGAVTP